MKFHLGRIKCYNRNRANRYELIQSDDESCIVHTIKTGGQASLLGFDVGDR